MKKLIGRFFADERASTVVEYGLVAAGISVAILAVLLGISRKLTSI